MSHQYHQAGFLLALLLLLPLALAAAATVVAPDPPCCAAFAPALPPRAADALPVLIFTLQAPLPERKGLEVQGRVCQCGGPFEEDEEDAPTKKNNATAAPPDAAASPPAPPPLVALRVRGSTSARDYAKKSFGLDASSDSDAFSLLGMPRDTKWALLGVQDDRTLGARTLLTFGAFRSRARGFGRWAPRARLAEVYVCVGEAANDGSAAVAAPLDYHGVYVATERVSRGRARVDVPRFVPGQDPADGGFLLAYENDNVKPGEPVVATRRSRLTLVIEYPSAAVLANASALAAAAGGNGRAADPVAHLTAFFDALERALLPPGPLVEQVLVPEDDAAAETALGRRRRALRPPLAGADDALATIAASSANAPPASTIAALPPLAPYLDAQAALDYFLLTELTKNPDGYRGSVKMHIGGRGGGATATNNASSSSSSASSSSSPLVMGPPWDYGEAFGSCCGFPIEGYKTAGRSSASSANFKSGGSAISPNGWRFNVCDDPGRCVVEPADGTSQWFRRLWQDAAFRAGAAARWQALRAAGRLDDAFLSNMIDANERRLVASGAAARDYALWAAERPFKAEEALALEKAGGVAGGVGVADPAAPAQLVAASLFLKQWVIARARWMDAALAAVADPAAPPDAYLRAAA